MAAPIADDASFTRALDGIFKSWTALQLAVSHGFGGAYSQEKAEWLVFATETWFSENSRIETYECEEFLEDVLNQEFDLIIEDGSLSEIAKKICRFYQLYKEKKYDEIKEYIRTLPVAQVNNCQKAESDEEVESDIDVIDDDPSTSGNTNQQPTQSTLQTSSTQQSSSNVSQSSRNESNMETEEEDDGWTVVGKNKKNRE
ncbi:hypothetical protein SNE40_014783 [Patella caerulea]|uniref:Pre-rRNA-processing protein TSR2 homolog n=1 Tax=Patella caerulea TaxID=87958 RepID=A0AAN8JGC4_PATCE